MRRRADHKRIRRVSDDDEVARDLRGAGAGIRQRVIGDGVRLPELPAVRRVERVQASIDRGHVHHTVMHGDSAVHQVAAGISRRLKVRLWIVAPQLFAGRCVDGVDVTPAAGGVHDPVDDDGRGLLTPPAVQHELPGEPEPPDVGLIDLRQRRIIGASEVAAAGVPVLRIVHVEARRDGDHVCTHREAGQKAAHARVSGAAIWSPPFEAGPSPRARPRGSFRTPGDRTPRSERSSRTRKLRRYRRCGGPCR